MFIENKKIGFSQVEGKEMSEQNPQEMDHKGLAVATEVKPLVFVIGILIMRWKVFDLHLHTDFFPSNCILFSQLIRNLLQTSKHIIQKYITKHLFFHKENHISWTKSGHKSQAYEIKPIDILEHIIVLGIFRKNHNNPTNKKEVSNNPENKRNRVTTLQSIKLCTSNTIIKIVEHRPWKHEENELSP